MPSPKRKSSKRRPSKHSRTASRRRTAKPKSKKVGGDRKSAARFAGKNDFGIPAKPSHALEEIRADQQRAADEIRNTPVNDRRKTDSRQPRSGTLGEGDRTSGVGGRDAGPGSSSGGDLDPDITGVGFAGDGLAEGGPDDPSALGQSESDGSSDEFASGGRAPGRNEKRRPRILRPGDTVNRGEPNP